MRQYISVFVRSAILQQYLPKRRAIEKWKISNKSNIHKEKSNKMQQCIKILLFHIYMKLNMFRVTHRSSSGA